MGCLFFPLCLEKKFYIIPAAVIQNPLQNRFFRETIGVFNVPGQICLYFEDVIYFSHEEIISYANMVEDILARTKKLVWPEIEKYLRDPSFPAEFQIPGQYQPDLAKYWKIIKEYPLRKGKYLRPTLVLLTAEAMGAKPAKAVKTAAAMQVSEDWLLIHDDIQDKSSLRRGGKTLHRMYGIELALNAGDSLQTIMWKILADNQKILGTPKILRILEEFFQTILRTEHGQAIEISWTKSKRRFTDRDYFFVIDGKTSYYTMALPLRLGAIIAGANQSQINKLTEFGLYLGRCFQLVDDILDLKQDKKEGKPTLPGVKGVKYARKLARQCRDQAKKIFVGELGFLKSRPARKNLEDLIDFILEREY